MNTNHTPQPAPVMRDPAENRARNNHDREERDEQRVGDFTAQLDAFRFGHTKKLDGQFLASFRIVDEGAHRNKHVRFSMTWTPSSHEFCVKTMRALGWDGAEEFSKLTVEKLSQRVRITVVSELVQRDGREFTVWRVKWISPLITVFNPMNTSQLDQLHAKVMRAMGTPTSGAEKGGQYETDDAYDVPSVPTGEPPADDDIPF